MDTTIRPCHGVGLDDSALSRALADGALEALLRERCPHAFAARPVFIADDDLARMALTVGAIESVVKSPAWQERVLAVAPAIARHDVRGTGGVFMGFDFHLDGGRLGLIEINTNAGGAMLNLVAARSQAACCAPAERLMALPHGIEAFEHDIAAMFRREWQRAGRTEPLVRIAIVDEDPRGQYLYPEFLLFQRFFERLGWQAIVTDPSELSFDGERLHAQAGPIDMVYNRMTDFDLSSTGVAAIREAYLADAVVLAPNPRMHALYADKRNLVLLSDDSALKELGVPAEVRDVLMETVPRTTLVEPAVAEDLWQRRRHLFFKPASGFGSRAAYRGDKLTRRVWGEIVTGRYVAQEIVAPGERLGDDGEALKYDLRQYAYDGRVQWVAARLFQGQTTNFRTPGGGFAPVYRRLAVSVCGEAVVEAEMQA